MRLTKWILILGLLASLSAWAGSFGGGRSGGGSFGGGRSSSFSGARSSSFGGSRSSGSPATISRPSAPRGASAPSTSNTTTIINNGGGGGGGFWHGYLWGSMNSQPAPVIVNPIVTDPTVVAQPVVIVQQHGFLFYFLWVMVALAVIAGICWAAEVFE